MEIIKVINLIKLLFVLLPIYSFAQDTTFNKTFKYGLNGITSHVQDDLIVQGSFGVGDDMDVFYDFGINTFVLHDDIVRWLFDDNSTNNFPSVDWSFIINDVQAGGSGYFRIKDYTTGIPFNIEAGAPTNSFFVQASTGFIGLGHTNPLANVHIKETSAPKIRIHQDGSTWPEFTWDLISDDSSFRLEAVSSGNKTPLIVEAGAPHNSLVISSDGNLGIGVENPEYALEVDGDIKAGEIKLGSWTLSVEDSVLIFDYNNGVKLLKLKKKQ
jgi:hypothetical protein